MKNKKTCIGIGLVSLDMLMRGDDETRVSCRVGGTCGNVMMILSHLGWDTYPIARLDGSQYSATMLRNMEQFGVHTDFVSTGDDGKPRPLPRSSALCPMSSSSTASLPPPPCLPGPFANEARWWSSSLR